MRIIFAKNTGFCFGVRRALEAAKKSFEKSPKPVHFLGEIIHNEMVAKEIKDRGGKIVLNPKEVKSGTLVIRAHGFPPFSLPKNVEIIDATCPLVKKAQEAARVLSRQGYKVIIIGEKAHPEVKGIKGYAGKQSLVIENESQAKEIKGYENKKMGVVAQTTQNIDKVDRILKILRKKTKKLKWLNTLCPAVGFRLKELTALAKNTDGILVIGSRSSANTGQLAEAAKKSKKPWWWINSLREAKKINFKGVSRLGVVSGTSTPDWEMDEIKKYLIKL